MRQELVKTCGEVSDEWSERIMGSIVKDPRRSTFKAFPVVFQL